MDIRALEGLVGHELPRRRAALCSRKERILPRAPAPKAIEKEDGTIAQGFEADLAKAEFWKEKMTLPERPDDEELIPLFNDFVGEDYKYSLRNLQKPDKDLIALSLKFSGRSAPGRDGLTGKSYRRVGQLAVDIIDEVKEDILDPASTPPPLSFSEAMLVSPAKVDPRELAPGVSGVKVSETRPLSLHIQVLRYIYVSIALAYAKVVRETVIADQDGFLRAPMHAILDADGAMILESRGRGRGGALLADMQRAFPSICPKFQEWMANKLEAPEWFKAALYKGFRRVTHVLYAHKKIGRRNNRPPQ